MNEAEQLGVAGPQTPDIESQRLGKVYARALRDAADKNVQAEAVFAELESLVNETLHADPVLRAFFASPAVPWRQKEQLITRAFEGKASELLVNFLLVLNRRGRLGLLRAVYLGLRDILDERANRLRIQVKTVEPMTDEQLHRLADELRGVMKREPVLVPKVDPSILGGMILQAGDRVYDHSVRSRLNDIRNKLLARGTNEISTGRDRFSDLG